MPMLNTHVVRNHSRHRDKTRRNRVSAHLDCGSVACCIGDFSLAGPSGSNDCRRRSSRSGRRATRHCHPLGPFQLAVRSRPPPPFDAGTGPSASAGFASQCLAELLSHTESGTSQRCPLKPAEGVDSLRRLGFTCVLGSFTGQMLSCPVEVSLTEPLVYSESKTVVT